MSEIHAMMSVHDIKDSDFFYFIREMDKVYTASMNEKLKRKIDSKMAKARK